MGNYGLGNNFMWMSVFVTILKMTDEQIYIEVKLPCSCLPKKLCSCFSKNEGNPESTESGSPRIKFQLPLPSLTMSMFLRSLVFITILFIPASTIYLTKHFGKEEASQELCPDNKTDLWRVNTDPPSYIFGAPQAQPGLVWGTVSIEKEIENQGQYIKESVFLSAYICTEVQGVLSDEIEVVKHLYGEDISFQVHSNCSATEIPSLKTEYISTDQKIENMASNIGRFLQKKDGKSKFFAVGQDALIGFNSVPHILRKRGFKINTLCR